MSEPLVLVIGIEEDVHVRAVNLALSDAGVGYVHLDPTDDGRLPVFTHVGESLGELIWEDGTTLAMEQVGSVFCRFAIDSLRPSPELPDIQKYGAFERLQGLLAPLRAIETTRWINDPWLEARADCKILQRGLAKSLGLVVPKQIISHDVDAIESFFGGTPCVVKPLSDTSIGVTQNEVYCDRLIPTADFAAPYTAAFVPSIAHSTASDGTPLLVQERIIKVADLRCIVIDDDVHAFMIPYRDGAPIDFRATKVERVQPYALDPATLKGLIALNRLMHVRYSACDLLLSPHGEEIFLEANVAGNWLFCDVANGMKVTRDLAQKLIRD